MSGDCDLRRQEQQGEKVGPGPKRKEILGGFLLGAELGLAQSLLSRKNISSENRDIVCLSVHMTWA